MPKGLAFTKPLYKLSPVAHKFGEDGHLFYECPIQFFSECRKANSPRKKKNKNMRQKLLSFILVSKGMAAAIAVVADLTKSIIEIYLSE